MRDKIKWFWQYYKKYPYVLAVLILLTPVQAILFISLPRLIEFTIDYVKTGVVADDSYAIPLSKIGESFGLSAPATFTLTIVVMGLFAFALYAYVQSHRAWMNLKLEWLFRQAAFDGITLKGPDFFNRFRTGDLVTRMTDDVAEKLSWFACSGIFRFYEAMILVIFTIAMMISIDPVLTLLSVGPLPFLIIIFFKSSTLLEKRYDHLQVSISNFNDVMESCFSGIRVVKAYVKEAIQKGKFKKAIEARREAEISAVKTGTIVDGLYMYIWQVGIIIVLLAGGYMVIKSNLSLGKMIAFIYYVIYLVFPMFDIGQFLVKSRQSAVSIGRLVELEKVAPMIKDEGNISIDKEFTGQIAFRNVDLSFFGSSRKIIDNISFEIPKGKTIAIVGKIGSGKSWLINMIPRLVDPTSGSITLDGIDLRNYRLKDLRSVIGYVPQEPALFSDTIRNNILFGRNNIPDSLMEWAIDVAQLKGEIESFPKGLDTLIGTRGMSISGGQKQRLALARALVGKPKILILDDCTSALDSRTEAALWRRLEEVMPGLTAIIITHRPDTLEHVDTIYVLDNGKIVESGSHQDLIAQQGVYGRIYSKYRLEEQVVEN